jgi:chemotaxis protein MotA
MVEGILSIQAGENPRIVEEKLKSFLPPIEREDVNRRRSREEGIGVNA